MGCNDLSVEEWDASFVNAYSSTREYLHALVQKLTARSPFKGRYNELVWCGRWDTRL